MHSQSPTRPFLDKLNSLYRTMENITLFLESSTIHGLYYISVGRKWSRFFWILIVLGGFFGAGYLIHESFDNWEKSPISTTIETLPISKIMFPNVTVCPPKQTFLTLNYDIMKSETLEINEETRKELITYAMNLIQEDISGQMMSNLSKVEDPDRYYNWYHGYTQIEFPFYDPYNNKLQFEVSSSATVGNISIQHFNESFDPNKVDGHIEISIYVFNHKNVESLKIYEINFVKVSYFDAFDEDKEDFLVDGSYYSYSESNNYNMNVTTGPDLIGPFSNSIVLRRDISTKFIKKLNISHTPGFSLKWKYDRKVDNWAEYKNDDDRKVC